MCKFTWYYDPSIGRFITEDPARDGLNWYVYCNNNPIKYTDKSGLAVWLVHGTFNNEPLYAEPWSGENNVEAREEGAKELRDMVMTYVNENGGINGWYSPIRLVGHSHGGNVAIRAANLLAEEGVTVETLVTIATPVRDDYQLNEGAVKQHINVYNTGDAVQANLGGRIQDAAQAGRTYEGANNVEVPKLPNRLRVINRGIANHGFMHNDPNIWENYIVPAIN